MATGNDSVQPDFAYISELVYSPAVPAALISTLHRPTSESKTWPKVAQSDLGIDKGIEIKPIDDPGHPANGQHGLFATRDFSPSEFVLFYLGRVHLNDQSDTNPESDYDLSLDRELGLSIDAQHTGNEARFINDYRGISDTGGPNAEFRDCWVQLEKTDTPSAAEQKESEVRTRTVWERRIGIFVLSPGKAAKRKRGIKRGDEILLNYGRSYWQKRSA